MNNWFSLEYGVLRKHLSVPLRRKRKEGKKNFDEVNCIYIYSSQNESKRTLITSRAHFSALYRNFGATMQEHYVGIPGQLLWYENDTRSAGKSQKNFCVPEKYRKLTFRALRSNALQIQGVGISRKFTYQRWPLLWKITA